MSHEDNIQITHFSQVADQQQRSLDAAFNRLNTDEKEITHPAMALGPEDPNSIQVSASRGILPSRDSAVTGDGDRKQEIVT